MVLRSNPRHGRSSQRPACYDATLTSGLAPVTLPTSRRRSTRDPLPPLAPGPAICAARRRRCVNDHANLLVVLRERLVVRIHQPVTLSARGQPDDVIAWGRE